MFWKPYFLLHCAELAGALNTLTIGQFPGSKRYVYPMVVGV